MWLNNGKCSLCKYPCLTCYYSATNCYSCGYGGATVRVHPYRISYYGNNYNRNCDCKATYFEENNECKKC